MRLLTRRPSTRRGTASVLAVITAMIVLGGFSPVGATALDPTAGSVLDGTLLVAHGDGAAGAMVMQTASRSASGVVPLTVPAAEHAETVALAGRTVQVRGSRRRRVLRGDEHLADSRARGGDRSRDVHADPIHARRGRAAAAPRKLRGAGQQGSLQAAMFGATKSVADWYSQMSGGQVTVTGTVYGYYGGVRSCDLATELGAAAAAAPPGGYVASELHQSRRVHARRRGAASRAWLGSAPSGVFLNGDALPGVIEHELGHNLGLMHAGAYAVRGRGRDGRLSDRLRRSHRRHGRPFGRPRLQRRAQVHAGLDPGGGGPDRHERHADDRADRRRRIRSSPGSTELIHVRAADGTLFAIDRRASVGFDAGLSGVWIRQVATWVPTTRSS